MSYDSRWADGMPRPADLRICTFDIFHAAEYKSVMLAALRAHNFITRFAAMAARGRFALRANVELFKSRKRA